MPRFTQDFAGDLDELVRCLLDPAEPPFAFVRFGDGEAAIMADRPYRTKIDGWVWPLPGGRKEGFRMEPPPGSPPVDPDADKHLASVTIREWLRSTARFSGEDASWCVGLPCPIHEPENHAIVKSFARVPPPQQTFAKLFSDNNYRAWKFRYLPQLMTLPEGRRPLLVGCRHAGRFYGDIEIPQNWMLSFRHTSEVNEFAMEIAELAQPGQPVLVAAGPMANALILEYWVTVDPECRAKIVDVGSSLDEFCSHRRSRVRTYDMLADHRWR
jgi:hypothetical protein